MSAGSIALDRYRDRYAPKPRRWATPGDLARHCEPTTLQTPALDAIDAAVVRVMDGDITKQQLAAPPQTGKSQRVSRWTPLWMLTCNPRLRIAIVSADLELARRWGRQIKRDIERHPDLGLTLRADSKAAGRWETTEGGSLFCTGIQAGTTGQPVDVLILDDVIKDRQQAESVAHRERAWEFWENDGGKRARKTIVMATRWKEDDLPGRLQVNEPGQWSVLSIPAIAESDDDPIGRTTGQEIQSANPELHPPGYYHRERETTSDYVWASLFQQRPAPAEGGLFRREQIQYWSWCDRPSLDRPAIYVRGREVYLETLWKFLTVDLAISKRTSADYTAVGVWGITLDGDLILLDGLRKRIAEEEHFPNVSGLRAKWDAGTVYVEAAQHGTTLVYEAGRDGTPIAKLTPDQGKFERAIPASNRAKAGRLFVPSPTVWPEITTWVDEWAAFDNAVHDDTVDVLAYAAHVAATHWVPMQTAEQELAGRPSHDPEYVDLMNASW